MIWKNRRIISGANSYLTSNFGLQFTAFVLQMNGLENVILFLSSAKKALLTPQKLRRNALAITHSTQTKHYFLHKVVLKELCKWMFNRAHRKAIKPLHIPVPRRAEGSESLTTEVACAPVWWPSRKTEQKLYWGCVINQNKLKKAAIKINVCVVVFRVKRRTVFICTWAAHDQTNDTFTDRLVMKGTYV